VIEPFEHHEPPASLTPDRLGAGWPYPQVQATPEEIRQASPEQLRAWVAQRLNWNTRHLAVRWFEGATPNGIDDWEGFFCPRCLTPKHQLSTVPCCPNWPGNNAQAWDLISILESQGYKWTIENNSKASSYSVGLTHSRTCFPDGFYSAEGDTVAITIARAFLLAYHGPAQAFPGECPPGHEQEVS